MIIRNLGNLVISYFSKAPSALEKKEPPADPVKPLSDVVMVPDEHPFPQRSDEINTLWLPLNKSQTRFASCEELGRIDLIDLEEEDFFQQIEYPEMADGILIDSADDQLTFAYPDRLCRYLLTSDLQGNSQVIPQKTQKASLKLLFNGTKERKCKLSDNQILIAAESLSSSAQIFVSRSE